MKRYEHYDRRSVNLGPYVGTIRDEASSSVSVRVDGHPLRSWWRRRFRLGKDPLLIVIGSAL